MDATGDGLAPRDPGRLLGSRLSYEIVMFHRLVGERLGLTLVDHKYLDLITREVPVTPKRIAELTGLTSGAVTMLIDRLSRAEFVRRIPHPDDRRRVQIVVDPERMADIGRLMAPLGHAMTARLDDMTPAELETATKFVERTIAALQEARRELEQRGST